jgi:hypothetical protein
VDPCPRDQLAELVRNEGPDLIQDAGRIRAFLRDACPDAHREVAALVAAVEENVPIRIQRSSDSLSVQGEQERLTRMLAQNRALTAGTAGWAVRSWAAIMGKGKAPDDAAEAGDAAVSDPGMRAMPREKLRELSQRYGPDLLGDSRRVKGLIQDLAPGYRREQAVIVAAVEEGIPQRIAATSGPVAKGDLARMAGTFSERRGLTDAAAIWGLQAWAWALGKGDAPVDSAATPMPTPPPEEPQPTPPPSTKEVPVGGPPKVDAPPPSPPPPPTRPDTWGPPPPKPREKKNRRPIVLTAVGAILALVAVLVAVANGNDTTYVPPYIPPDTTSPPITDPPETTDTSLSDIEATFTTPSDSCEEASSDIPDGAEYVLLCEVAGVDVRYIKWDSVVSMDTHFDQDKQLTGYEEGTWHYNSSPDVEVGRFIEYEYNDSRGLDWTLEDRLVSGEALSDSMTQEELKEWWREEPMG